MRPLMIRSSGTRRDPAPSRIRYRLTRLWLTPLFRAALLKGVPILALGLGVWWYLGDPARLDDLRARIAEVRRAIEERPEFMVHTMEIRGASAEVDEDLREILPVDFPVSSFDLDVVAMRKIVEELDAVAAAEVRIRSGGVLEIRVTERVPAVVWRRFDGLDLLDREGHRVASIAHRGDRADLPLIAGEGADEAVPEALAILAAARPVAPRIRGLRRIGARRWDIILDRGQIIRLPETGAVDATERVMALDQAAELLDRDISVVDLRDPSRMVLRLNPGAVAAFRSLRGLAMNEDT
ncbi:MAG: cell division protein FtsQ [Alphaproteobacteria bacterium]|nr:MAG: cell division protein FtsQ [Alphaproteobacteria bacterium]